MVKDNQYCGNLSCMLAQGALLSRAQSNADWIYLSKQSHVLRMASEHCAGGRTMTSRLQLAEILSQFEDHLMKNIPFRPMSTIIKYKQYFAQCITAELLACKNRQR